MLSEAKDAEKLAAFKREVERNAKLAPVLASAFHRRPQGAFAIMPRAIELEAAVRDVMSGARQAMRAMAEELGTVPPHAEVDALLKAVQAARLHRFTAAPTARTICPSRSSPTPGLRSTGCLCRRPRRSLPEMPRRWR